MKTLSSSTQSSRSPAAEHAGPVQAKLEVGEANDAFEREADIVAEKVMSGASVIQRKCAHCEEEEKLQKKSLEEEDEKLPIQPKLQLKRTSDNSQAEAPTWVQRQIENSRGSGQNLPSNTRSFMESGMGSRFGGVKIHTDSKAIQMNRALGARAFTVGNDIYFNADQYSPQSREGRKLLAHELTHVVQQGASSRFSPQPKLIQRAGPCEEAPVRVPHHLMVRGSVHPDVREIQRKLVIFSNNEVAAGRDPLPNMPLVDDCIFGPKTQAAVLEFQKRVFPSASNEWDSKVGDHTWAEIDAVSAAPPVTPPTPAPPTPAPPAPAATITSETVATSPGSRARQVIGVGEEVTLTHTAGTATTAWTTSAGTLSATTGASVVFTAPDVAKFVMITAGGAPIFFFVLAPTGVHMDRFSGTGIKHTVGQPDCGIETQPFLLPDNVNFGNVIYQEQDVLAVSNGTYSCHNGAVGHCGHGGSGGCGDLLMLDTVVAGKGTQAILADCVYSGHCGQPAPFTPGTLRFSIPYEYKVGTGSFHRFATVEQVHVLQADGVSMTADKAGAHGAITVPSLSGVIPQCP